MNSAPAGNRANRLTSPTLRLNQSSGFAPVKAQVAELVDALASGASARMGVEVRVFSWAPFLSFVMEISPSSYL